MSKKRVHEIARELKSFGIELDNREVVTELTSLGYDVKSHSSSLEDDQATAAVQRIVEKRRPKAAPAPVAAKRFVVRRRGPGPEAHPGPNGTLAEPVLEAPAIAPAPAIEPPPPEAAAEVVADVQAEVVSAPLELAPVALPAASAPVQREAPPPPPLAQTPAAAAPAAAPAQRP